MEIGHAALLRLTRRTRDAPPAYRRRAIKISKETVSQLTGRFTTATQVPEVKANLSSRVAPVRTCRAEFGAYLRKPYNEYGRISREANIKTRLNRAPETFHRSESCDRDTPRHQRAASPVGFSQCINLRPGKSAMGHSRRFDRTTATFGLPPATDIVSAGRHGLFRANKRHHCLGALRLHFSLPTDGKRAELIAQPHVA